MTYVKAFGVDWYAVGLSDDSPMINRLYYSFFHASFIHLVLNLWCLTSIVFLHGVSQIHYMLALVIAMMVPECVLTNIPTVGLSVFLYGLLGIITFEMQRKVLFILCMLAYVAVGFLIPHVNALIHLYAYGAGVIVSFLITPIIPLDGSSGKMIC